MASRASVWGEYKKELRGIFLFIKAADPRLSHFA